MLVLNHFNIKTNQILVGSSLTLSKYYVLVSAMSKTIYSVENDYAII